jgi:murein DD-endopeptidase MepM/ murein hydrolase activator NlpD
MPNVRTFAVIPFVIGALSMALPAAAAADVPHVVLPGETLTSVAAADGLSVIAVAEANGLSPTAELIVGQVLEIPAQTSSTTAQTATHTTDSDDVQLDADVTTTTNTSAATTTANTSAATTTATVTKPVSTTTGTAGPVPTPEHVSAAEIAQIADADGVPAGLAEGIAWQESGWSNDVVSPIGAVGVMQIVPTTWTWIDQYLTPSDPLGTASAAQNVRAGVLLLHDLLAVTGDNEQLAIAAYYQGLASVRKYGMYADTRQYVADVLALAARFGG